MNQIAAIYQDYLLGYLGLCWDLMPSHPLPHRATNAVWVRKVNRNVPVRKNSTNMLQKQRYFYRWKTPPDGTAGSCEPHRQRLAGRLPTTRRRLHQPPASLSHSQRLCELCRPPRHFFSSWSFLSFSRSLLCIFRFFRILPSSFPSQSLHPRSFYSLSRLGKKLRLRCNTFRPFHRHVSNRAAGFHVENT